MKVLFLFAALLTGSVQATELETTTCTRTNLCFNVPTDDGTVVNYISNATQYRRLIVDINGDMYDSGLWTMPPFNGVSQTATLYDANGKSIYVTLNWSIVTGSTCMPQGHTCVFPKVVTLVSGTIN